MRTLHDMVTYGGGLNNHVSWDAWPKGLPLFIYHGAEDPICCPKAAVRFGDMVVSKDKTTKLLPVSGGVFPLMPGSLPRASQ